MDREGVFLTVKAFDAAIAASPYRGRGRNPPPIRSSPAQQGVDGEQGGRRRADGDEHEIHDPAPNSQG